VGIYENVRETEEAIKYGQLRGTVKAILGIPDRRRREAQQKKKQNKKKKQKKKKEKTAKHTSHLPNYFK